FDDAEFAATRRRDFIAVGDEPATLEAVFLDSGNRVAVKANDHYAALGDARRIERDALLNGAHIIPRGLVEDRSRGGRAKTLHHGVARVDPDLRIRNFLIVAVGQEAIVGVRRRARRCRCSGSNESRRRKTQKSALHPSPFWALCPPGNGVRRAGRAGKRGAQGKTCRSGLFTGHGQKLRPRPWLRPSRRQAAGPNFTQRNEFPTLWRVASS